MAALGFALVTVGTYGFTQMAVDTTGAVAAGAGWCCAGWASADQHPVADAGALGRQQPRDGARLVAGERDAPGVRRNRHLHPDDVLRHADERLRNTASQEQCAAVRRGDRAEPQQRLAAGPDHAAGPARRSVPAPFGPQAAQNQAAIQQCVQQHIQQQTAQATQAHLPQIVQQVFPAAATHALNDTFLITMIGCGIAIVLALFLGRDPSITAARRAAATGEVVSEAPRPAMVAE